MSTLRERIIAAVVTALNTGRPSNVPEATRLKTTPYEPSQLPAITVYPVREEVEDVGGRFGPIVKRALTLRVECRATGDPVDQKLDPMLAWATKALSGNDLGGLVIDIAEAGTEWAVEPAEAVHGIAIADFTALYATKTNDQEAEI
jgi:hypothetical protein